MTILKSSIGRNLRKYLKICSWSYSLNYNGMNGSYSLNLRGMNFNTRSMSMCGWDLGFFAEAFQGTLSMKVKGRGRLDSEKH